MQKDDIIYRHAAIDALEEPRKVSDTWTDEYAVGERMQWEKDVKALNSLPSAQPEQPTKIQDILTYLDEKLHPIVSPENWNVYSELHDMISGLSAQPEQRWIPVSEKLPDELAEVNITWINTDPEPYYDFVKDKSNTGTGVYYKGRWYWSSAVCVDYLGEYGFSPNDEMDDAINVVSWMPLPEPYKEEGVE